VVGLRIPAFGVLFAGRGPVCTFQASGKQGRWKDLFFFPEPFWLRNPRAEIATSLFL
jgi:hypothetical protein